MNTQSGGNLPIEMTSFVGRREVITQAKNLFASARLLSLTGMGGVGKTRLAIRLARELRRDFPDGAWLIELADLNQDSLLAPSVARVLGIRDEWNDSTEHLIHYLSERRALLIFDNCEHLVDVCSSLITRILHASPHVKIIATSRQVLGIEGEQVFPVPPLSHTATSTSVNEAMQLFEERASAADPAFRITDDNRRDVERICRALEGLPLAVELAAANIRTFSTTDIAAHLHNDQLLRATERTRPSRHHTMSAVADWSYRLCAPDEQRLWEQLSVFAGGFTVDAAKAVFLPAAEEPDEPGGHADIVLRALIGLVDKSIVSRIDTPGSPGRYRMLEPVRQYGAAQLSSSPHEDTVRRHHRDYFLHLAERSQTDYCSIRDVEWYATTRAEHANLREALDYSLCDRDNPEIALQMASVLRPFWVHSGSILEGYEWLRRALDGVRTPSPERTTALATASLFGFYLGRLDEAHVLLREHKELAEHFGEGDNPILTLFATGVATFEDGDIDKAIVYAEKAVEWGVDRADPGLVAETLALTVLCALIEQHPRTEEFALNFLRFAEEHEAHLLKAVALFPLGAARWFKGDRDGAVSLMREAIRLYQMFEHPGMIAVCIEGLAWSAAADDPERAAVLLGVASARWRHSQMWFAQEAVHRVTADIETVLRKELGADRFDRALQSGQALSFEASVALALGDQAPPERPGRNRVADAGLTRREREIAILVADGLTNKQIAAKLVISPRTVDAHVENVLKKLGFRSRTQIARWMTTS